MVGRRARRRSGRITAVLLIATALALMVGFTIVLIVFTRNVGDLFGDLFR